MIYSVYFSGLYNSTYDRYGYNKKHPLSGKIVDSKKLLAKFIRESENNTFLFILTKDMWAEFQLWLDEEQLNSLISFQMEDYITNPVHNYNGRNLKLVVIQTANHFINDLFEEAEEMFNSEMENQNAN